MNWTQEQADFIRANYLTMKNADMGKALGRSRTWVETYMRIHDLTGQKKTGKAIGFVQPKYEKPLAWKAGLDLQIIWPRVVAANEPKFRRMA